MKPSKSRRPKRISFKTSFSAEELLTLLKNGLTFCLLTSIVSVIAAHFIVFYSEKNAFEMHEVEFNIRPLYGIIPKSELALAVDNSELGKITISQIDDKKIARVGRLRFIIWHDDVSSAETMFRRLLISSEKQMRESLIFKYSESTRINEFILSSPTAKSSPELTAHIVSKYDPLPLQWIKDQLPFYDFIFTSQKVEKLNVTPFIYLAAALLGIVSGITITLVRACMPKARKGHQS